MPIEWRTRDICGTTTELVAIVQSNRVPDNHMLSFKLTNEGLIIDQLDENGEVVATFANTYDELIEDVVR